MFPILEHIRVAARKAFCGAHKSARLFLPLPPRKPPECQGSENVQQCRKRGSAQEKSGRKKRKAGKYRFPDASRQKPPFWRKPIPKKKSPLSPSHAGSKKVFAKKLTFKSLLKISTQFNFCWKAARKCCRVFSSYSFRAFSAVADFRKAAKDKENHENEKIYKRPRRPGA